MPDLPPTIYLPIAAALVGALALLWAKLHGLEKANEALYRELIAGTITIAGLDRRVSICEAHLERLRG